MAKIWKGEKSEKLIESDVNLMRKEVIRYHLYSFSVKYEEIIQGNRGVRFIAKDFYIDYVFLKEICHVSVPGKFYVSFPADSISEVFDFLVEKSILILKEK